MLGSEQQLVNIPFKFLSFATTNGKMFWWNDSKRKRTCLIPQGEITKRTNRIVYGALYMLDNYEWYENALHSYYNSMASYTDLVCANDYMKPQELLVRPIKFKTLTDLSTQHYDRGGQMVALGFVVNTDNSDMNRWYRAQYHKMQGIDKQNFIKAVQERSK